MKPTVIVASCVREAIEVARRHKLKSGEWRYAHGPEVLEGLRDPIILATKCWPWIGPVKRVADIERCLESLKMLYGTEVTTVDCE